jgi:hypothetical protein
MTAVDVLVLGSTPAGIAASLAAKLSGRSVLLASSDDHVGGMMSGGLGWDDVNFEDRVGLPPATTKVEPAVYGNRSTYARFAALVEAHYAALSPLAKALSVNGTRHEPRVAEDILSTMLREANITVLLRRRIVRLERSPADGKIVTVSLERDSEEAERVEPRLVIDATYEADSLPMASTPFRLGRESRVEFGEMNAGSLHEREQEAVSAWLHRPSERARASDDVAPLLHDQREQSLLACRTARGVQSITLSQIL